MSEPRPNRIIPAELILQAYRCGAFPMADASGRVRFYSTPHERAVFDPCRFHTPRSVRRLIRQGRFEIRIDSCFEQVIRACADRPQTWINETIIASYLNLHRLGYAHSVEAFSGNELAGGLYGVALGGAFFGESMFHRISGASKVALIALLQRLRERDYILLDSQYVVGRQFEMFGVQIIPFQRYLQLLGEALRLDRKFTD